MCTGWFTTVCHGSLTNSSLVNHIRRVSKVLNYLYDYGTIVYTCYMLHAAKTRWLRRWLTCLIASLICHSSSSYDSNQLEQEVRYIWKIKLEQLNILSTILTQTWKNSILQQQSRLRPWVAQTYCLWFCQTFHCCQSFTCYVIVTDQNVEIWIRYTVLMLPQFYWFYPLCEHMGHAWLILLFSYGENQRHR